MASPINTDDLALRNVTKELENHDMILNSLLKTNKLITGQRILQEEVQKLFLSNEQKIELLTLSIEAKVKDMAIYQELLLETRKKHVAGARNIVKEQEKLNKLVLEEINTKGMLEKQEANHIIKHLLGLTNLSNKAKQFKQLFKASPEILAGAIALVGLFYILKQILSVFDELDSAAADFRKSMGITRSSSADIEKTARNISIRYMMLGVAAKDVYDSFKSIAEAAGSSKSYTDGMVSDMSLFSAQFGITTQISAKFLKTMAMISKSTMGSQRDMMLFAQYMSSAAGVPLDAIMNDIAGAAEAGYQYLSHDVLELTKAAVQAKLMGTSLQSTVKSSSSLLMFTESVKKEMEASVLLGYSFNIQKARQLAYSGKLIDLNKEILRLAKESNFEQLDPFQQNAVAEALGKSAGEIAGMLESDREHQHVLQAMTLEQRKQYDLLMNANKSQAKNYAELARKEIQTISNQKAMAAISLAWRSIFANLGAVILPPIAAILTTIAKVIGSISEISSDIFSAWIIGMSIWKPLFGLIKGVGMVILAYSNPTSNWFNILNKIGIVTNKIGGWFSKIGSWFKPVVALFSKFGAEFSRIIAMTGKFGVIFTKIFAIGAVFGKWLTPIGWVVAAIQFIYYLFKEIGKVEWVKGPFWKNLGWNILLGLGAVITAIYDTLLKPFYDIYLWIKKHLMGSSPSEIGLGILKGIQAVGGMLIHSLLSPYITAWKLIQKIPFVSHLSSKIGPSILKGIQGIEGMLIKSLISSFQKAWNFIKSLPFVSHLFGNKNIGIEANNTKVVPTINMEKPKEDINPKKASDTPNTVINDMNETLSKRIDMVVDAINSLRDDFKNGTITANVFLDSQKLDSAVGRRLAYTGTLT